MRKDRPDLNKAAIVADLRERGYLWLDIGGSVDGLCIGYNHNTHQVEVVLVEIKNPVYPVEFTEKEKRLMAELNDRGYHGVHITARDAEDVLQWYGAI